MTKIQITKTITCFEFVILNFDIISDFGFRNWDFLAQSARVVGPLI